MNTTSRLFRRIPWSAFALFAVAVTLTSAAFAEYTPTTLYTFPFNEIQAFPSTLLMDSAGNLFGTTISGGSCVNPEACGTVFELSPQPGGGWTQTTIYSSSVGNLGAPLIMDAASNLYGTISTGGNGSPKYCSARCGSVFELSPGSGGWTFTTLFSFHGSDGGNPGGALVFDSAGSLYGTTAGGGTPGFGTAYKLTPTAGGWQHKVIHFFTNGTDGKRPNSALTIDAAGNLYGVAEGGLIGGLNTPGVAFRLTPVSGGNYHFQYIHAFTGGTKGVNPTGPLLLDATGNLFGTTYFGGSTKTICTIVGGCGIVYELQNTGTGYVEKVLHQFVANVDGGNPLTGVVADSSGNLYGTTTGGVDGKVKIFGTVFKLTPTSSGWTETTLLTGTKTLGDFLSGVILDSAGNLYGSGDGSQVFQLSPPAP